MGSLRNWAFRWPTARYNAAKPPEVTDDPCPRCDRAPDAESAASRLDARGNRRLIRTAVAGAHVPRRAGASAEFRSDRSADFDASVVQDGRLLGRLRLLSAV